jgi:ABC-type sugar transport system ATPase subunit
MVEIGRTIEIARETTRALNASDADHGTPLVILDELTSVLERNETEILEREIRKLKGDRLDHFCVRTASRRCCAFATGSWSCVTAGW